MKIVMYLVGFLVGLLVVYLFGALVAWDLNPGNWGGLWRLWCIVWIAIWGHIAGLLTKSFYRSFRELKVNPKEI